MLCPHMDQVLTNKVLGDAVLRECETVKQLLRQADWKSKSLHAMRCMECGEMNCGSTFICLQCGFCGCWNNGHFMEHAKKHGHIFGVNSSNGLVFCFKCGDYIADLVTEIPSSEWSAVTKRTTLPARASRDGLHGLVNMGSTCFMSSIIQVIMHNPVFVRELLSQRHYNDCPIKSGQECVSCALDEIATDFYGIKPKDQPTAVSKGFTNLLTACWRVNPHLVGSSQQDAHEFWQFILNQIHLDHSKIYGSSKAASCKCISHRNFQGYLKNTLQCPQCGFTKTTIDPIMDLSLEIKNKTSLEECLDHFQRQETLTDFKYECENCKYANGMKKQLALHKLPNVLVIQLKRFEHLVNGKSVKLNDPVQFPSHLNLKHHLIASDTIENIPNIAYDLQSVVSHQGTVDQGHYTTVSKARNDQWFKFNDSVVTSITEQQVLQQQAYLLFYNIR